MPISFDHNIFLIHVPKTGGQSLYKPLGIKKNRESWWGLKDLEYHHLTASEVKKRFPAYSEYFSIAVVRNPLDRLVSEYHYKRLGDNRFITARKKSFKDFVLELNEKFPLVSQTPQNIISHFKAQTDFVFDNGVPAVGKVFKYEEFNTLETFVKEKTGQEIPHLNRTKHKPYLDYYTPALIEIVKNLYRQDFDNFGY